MRDLQTWVRWSSSHLTPNTQHRNPWHHGLLERHHCRLLALDTRNQTPHPRHPTGRTPCPRHLTLDTRHQTSEPTSQTPDNIHHRPDSRRETCKMISTIEVPGDTNSSRRIHRWTNRRSLQPSLGSSASDSQQVPVWQLYSSQVTSRQTSFQEGIPLIFSWWECIRSRELQMCRL